MNGATALGLRFSCFGLIPVIPSDPHADQPGAQIQSMFSGSDPREARDRRFRSRVASAPTAPRTEPAGVVTAFFSINYLNIKDQGDLKDQSNRNSTQPDPQEPLAEDHAQTTKDQPFRMPSTWQALPRAHRARMWRGYSSQQIANQQVRGRSR